MLNSMMDKSRTSCINALSAEEEDMAEYFSPQHCSLPTVYCSLFPIPDSESTPIQIRVSPFAGPAQIRVLRKVISKAIHPVGCCELTRSPLRDNVCY